MKSDQCKKNVEPKGTVSNSTKDKYNEQSNSRMKNFINSDVNPDNNAYYTERSNHLSSKGD